MEQSLAVAITLCYQFESEYYKKSQLKSCISRATEEAEELIEDNINMVFEDIENANLGNMIHENITNSIRKSHIVIFELSDVNPNVLYELGIASGLQKPIIIIREENSKEELPSDINQLIYLTYNKEKLDRFHHELANTIVRIYNSYDETSFISASLKEKILYKYAEESPEKIFEILGETNKLRVLRTKRDFSTSFKDVLASSTMNFYYVGAMGFLSSGKEWIDMYTEYFSKGKIFSRIIYLQSLEDFYQIYDDEDMLINYCVWLAQNYYLLKLRIIAISHSKDISIWKNGLSFIVSDEKKLLMSTGAFTDQYNNKGFLIENEEIAKIFKEYSKILSIKSKKVKTKDFLHYFSFGEELKEIPPMINDALDSGNYGALRDACEQYVLSNIEF
jgi:nucleoside 2-deoxyribosyltransferase